MTFELFWGIVAIIASVIAFTIIVLGFFPHKTKEEIQREDEEQIKYLKSRQR